MKGIDVSGYQENVNYNQQKNSGVEVCYIKATEGLTYNNPLLKSQYNRAKAVGMKVGFYHYLRANDPIAEAKHFLSVISGLTSDCLYCIDAEQQSEAVGVSARIRAFADYLISQKKSPMIYTGLYFYRDEILGNCKNIPLWVASYCSSRPSIKSVGWQYTESPIDMNIFDKGVLLSGVKGVSTSQQPQLNTGNDWIRRLQAECNRQGFSNQKVDGYFGVNTVNGCPTMRQGARGNLTRLLQEKLNKLTYNTNGVDGIYGSTTFNAICNYQSNHGLSRDGICGKGTWAELIKQ